MAEWEEYQGLNTRLGAPITDFALPAHYNRKQTRSMGRVSQLATVAELALARAGLLGDPRLSDGRTGIAYGSSVGSSAQMGAFGQMISQEESRAHLSHHLCADHGPYHGTHRRTLFRAAWPGDPHLQRLHLRQSGHRLCGRGDPSRLPADRYGGRRR